MLGHESRPIPCFLKGLDQGGDVRANLIEAQGPRVVRVASRHPSGATRLANGDGHVAVFESKPLSGELVNVRSDVRNGIAVDPDRIARHVIYSDQEDVRGSCEAGHDGQE
jgi:hypothetical protein